MQTTKNFCKQLIAQKWFEILIIAIIFVNSALIGVETYTTNATIKLIQHIILGIFTFEILVRFIARDSLKSFFTSGWNIFDLTLVLVSYIPESLFANSSLLMVVRVLRVFRVLRLLRTADEIKLIVSVLIKSFSALFYNGIFFFIFLYLFAIMGVSLFRLPDYQGLDAEGKIRFEAFIAEAPAYSTDHGSDPYGTLSESMFTLFRVLTGDNWTDLRYNLVKAKEFGFIQPSSIVVTCFHIVWFILSAFLLLNLVVGAIVNNYHVIMEEHKAAKKLEAELKAIEANTAEEATVA